MSCVNHGRDKSVADKDYAPQKRIRLYYIVRMTGEKITRFILDWDRIEMIENDSYNILSDPILDRNPGSLEDSIVPLIFVLFVSIISG